MGVLWLVLGVILSVVLFAVLAAGRAFSRFRGMCRGVRNELTALIQTRHPEVTVIGEPLGNLLLRLPSGEERLWELADLFTAVGRLPGMGADADARAHLYHHAVERVLGEASAPPLTSARILPRLVRGDELGASALHRPVPGLPLQTAYVSNAAPSGPFLTDDDAAVLGLDRDAVHRTALENLRASSPADMVEDALGEDAGTALQLGDSFDAARLLLVPELLRDGHEVVALALHRDLLVLLPGSVLQDRPRLEEAMTALDCDHPKLLDRPVRVTAQGFELL